MTTFTLPKNARVPYLGEPIQQLKKSAFKKKRWTEWDWEVTARVTAVTVTKRGVLVAVA